MTFTGELEERMAAQWAHYKWREYKDLDGDEQADIIAAYRASNQIEGVLAEKAGQKAKK